MCGNVFLIHVWVFEILKGGSKIAYAWFVRPVVSSTRIFTNSSGSKKFVIFNNVLHLFGAVALKSGKASVWNHFKPDIGVTVIEIITLAIRYAAYII